MCTYSKAGVSGKLKEWHSRITFISANTGIIWHHFERWSLKNPAGVGLLLKRAAGFADPWARHITSAGVERWELAFGTEVAYPAEDAIHHQAGLWPCRGGELGAAEEPASLVPQALSSRS